MGWRKSHGTYGKGVGGGMPVIEVKPVDELAKPIPGRLKTGGATKVKLSRSLTLKVPKHEWVEYLDQAEKFRRHQCRQLAMQSGGRCGAAPSSMVASAALQLAMSRFMFDRGCAQDDMAMVKMASGLANDSRQNLLAAYELALRECQARAMYAVSDPHLALAEALVSEESTPIEVGLEPTPLIDPMPSLPDSETDKSEPRR